MPEALTMNDTPADQPDMNTDEQDSLQVAESLEGAEQPLLAGKFKDQSSLEQAYIALQKKLGEPSDEPEAGEEVEQEEQPAEENTEKEESSDFFAQFSQTESQASIPAAEEPVQNDMNSFLGDSEATSGQTDELSDWLSQTNAETDEPIVLRHRLQSTTRG